MPLTRSLAAAAAAAIALNAAAVSAADMETTNAMPSSFGGTCQTVACKQGFLFAEAMSFNDEFEIPTFSYAIGADLGGAGWAAGPVTEQDAENLYQYDDWMCQLKLRGVTILRIMNAMVSSDMIIGENDDATSAPLLQYNNVRVKYSTTLPATNRLLSVEAKDPATGEYKPIDRTALYTVNTQEYDYDGYEPYDTWTASPSLTGEGVECGDVEYLGGELVENFLKAKSPYTIPEVSQALASEAGGTAMVVEQDAAMCKAMTPPHKYDAGLESCVPCPPGSTSTGTECEAVATAAPVTPAPVTPAPVTPAPVTAAPVTAAPVTAAPVTAAPVTQAPVTPAPVTPAPVTPAPVTQAPVTPAPVTPAPVTQAPVTPAPVTPAPVTPAAASPTPAPGANPTVAPTVASGSTMAAPATNSIASSGSGSSGAVTESAASPTPAPAAMGRGRGAGTASGGAAAPSSGSSVGLIIGVVVGVVALIAVAAIVGIVVMRNRASGATTTSDGLDSRLEPVDGDQLVVKAEKASGLSDDSI